jgi:hypothetical protein
MRESQWLPSTIKKSSSSRKNMPLPKAELRAWPVGTFQALAGFAEIAGGIGDLEDAMLPRAWKHPWVGLTVDLPNGRGKIMHCINHPQGEFLFDVGYPEPVPPIHNGKLVLVDNPTYHQQSHRYHASELQELAK